MTDLLKPKIRFKGFTDVWEQRKLENIFNYERPDKYIVSSTEYLEFGPTPVLTANKAFILGYTTEKNKYVNSKESIIFDDFTLDTKFVDFPYMVKSSAIKILTLKDVTKNNIRFNFELLSNHKFNMLGHARHYISVVQPEKVFTPNKQEQDRIGELFTNLDNLITLHHRKYSTFFYSWEQRKLGDECFELIAGGDIDKTRSVNNGKYPIYANALTNDGIVGYYNDSYRVKSPAVTITGRGEIGYAMARNTDFTPVVRLISLRSKHNNYFLANAINLLNVVSESTGVPQLTIPQVEKFDIYFPKNINEEIKLGRLFNEIDNIITLHQHKE